MSLHVSVYIYLRVCVFMREMLCTYEKEEVTRENIVIMCLY